MREMAARWCHRFVCLVLTIDIFANAHTSVSVVTVPVTACLLWGQEPWSSGFGRRAEGRGFESQRRILDGHFFTFIC